MGKLLKLKIEAFKYAGFEQDTPQSVGSFEVELNPDNYKRSFRVNYENAQGKSTSAKSQKYGKTKDDGLQLEFFIDGTGISTVNSGEIPTPIDVEKKIRDLIKLVKEIDPESHRPGFLKVSWGDLIKRCVLESLDIDYTLFDNEGKPLRAKVNVKFRGAISNEHRDKKERKNSPDLTHFRTMERSDRIDYTSFEIYRDPTYYMKVAKFNNLVSFRNLPLGTVLKFPPLKNKQKEK